MNQFRSWLYGHSNKGDASYRQSWRDSVETSTTNGDGQSQTSESNFRNAILRVIPLAPEDCLECKLVGSGVMLLSGVIVMTSALTAPTRSNASPKITVTGPRKTLYYAICGGLFLAFEAAGICRLFDFGPFSKSASGDLEK